MREVVIICRLSSKDGQNYYRRLNDELPKRGVKIVEAHMVSKRKELKKRIRQAIKSKKEYIVVVGGDGTQTAAVAELAYSDTIMCVVPAGTGNSFALGLGIKNDIDLAIETIAGGKEMRVDVGCVNGTYFANFAAIGILAEAAERTSKPLKKIIGPLAYGVGMIPVLRRKPFELRVKWPGNDLKILTHQAILAAGKYYGWQPLTPQAGVRSGELAFFCAAGSNAADVVKTNAALVLGHQTQMDGAHFFAAPEIAIKCKPKQAIGIDGHLLGKTNAKFRVARKALRVLVPQHFEARD
ncbi:MAG: diacylglycerol kinase family protein [Candidatus Baltobacteraceae bacterium]